MTGDDRTDTGRVERHGDTVHRPVGFWSPAVHDLLCHLENVGFPAPRVLHADDRVEVLTWLDGESGPAGWAKVVPESGLREWARFLRRYHDAVAGYRPPADAEWSSGRAEWSRDHIVCHGDFGPWNAVWDGAHVIGLIDFDHARPAVPLFDISYALEYVAPFRSDDECIRWLRYPSAPDRHRRIEIFCTAYGIPVPDDVIGCVAEEQREVLATCTRLAGRGIEPQVTWVAEGYLDELRDRIRWTESFRS